MNMFDTIKRACFTASRVTRHLCQILFVVLLSTLGISNVYATSFTETVPNGNGPIPNTFPPVGGTMFVLIGANGNIYYQFVNPSTQFEGFQLTGQPVAFRGNPFQLGPTQALNCGPTACVDYFGGSIVEGYARLTARDGDACAGNFDFDDVFFEVNGTRVGSFSGPQQVERTNRTGTTSLGFENCFRNQGSNETSTGWFDLTPVPGLLNNILTTGSTTPFVFDDDGTQNGRGDNLWFFRDGDDAIGTPEVAPGVTIVKTADRTDYTAVNDIINYEFLVTNVGSVQLTNVVVTDSFINSAVSCPSTTLASGANMICTGQHTVTQQNLDDDVIFRNIAQVTATPTEGTLGAVSGELSIPGPVADNQMTITKVPSITTGADVGDTITYTYEIQNTGNITLNNVNVSDVHNGAGTLSAITPTDVTLAPLATQQFTATYVVQQGDVDAQTDITNTATAEAVPARGTIVEPTAPAAVSVVPENRVLTLDKESPTTDFVNAGDVIDYTYLVTNDGNVSITAPLTIADDIIDAAGGNVSCPAIPVGGLLPGASLTCIANYSVSQADVDLGTVTNIATATDGTATSNQDTVIVTGSQNPALAIDKRLTSASPTSYDSVGDQLFYEYEVRNSGNVTITAPISVSDNLIASVICPALPAGGLAPNATLLCTGDYAVDQNNIDTGSVTNTADATDGTVTSPTDDVTVNATQLPALSLTKTADPIDPTDFIIGAAANYTYVVTNSGNTTIVDPITVDDSRIPNVVCPALPAGGLLPTQTISCSGSYTVDANDVALFEVTNLATATDGNVTSAQVSETIPLGGVPSLSLAKTAAAGSSFTNVGDTITYSFVITNDGTVSFATPITITDNTIPGTPIECFVPTPANPDLTPGETHICTGTFTYAVDQDDLDSTEVINEATANTTFRGTTPVVSSPATATVNSNNDPSIAVIKTSNPTSFTTLGESITYTLTANNDGNQTLTNITLSDPLIPSLMCTVPTLAPGATDNSCVGTYVVDQDDIDLGRIDNTASASATTPQGTTINGSGSLTINGPAPAPAVEVIKVASPSPFGAEGSLINYTFEVRNAGNVSLSNIIVTDPIDAGFSCTIASLNPGISDTTSCSLNYTVLQSDINTGSITNEASVTAISGDPSGQSVSDSDQIVTPGPTRDPAIEIEKVANTSGLSTPVQVGDIISYTFRLENTGNVTLTNVTANDADATVIGSPIASFPPGAIDTSTFTATRELTQDDINSGSFANQATADAETPAGLPSLSEPSDDPTTPAGSDPTVVTLPATPSMSLVKVGTLNDGGDGRADVGDTINYTFTVENTGNVTITNISIADAIVMVAGGPIVTLQPGVTDTSTFTASYVITQGDINRGNVQNEAVVSGAAPDGSTVSDDSDDPANATGEDDPTIIPLARVPSIELEKVATLIDGGDGVDEGDTIEYAFTVTNTGNVSLTNVTITDALVSVAGGPISLEPGVVDSATFTAVYSIQQADIDAGIFTNTATVNSTDPQGANISDVSDDPADATGNDDPTTVTFPQTPEITIEKIADASGFSSPPVAGDEISYTFRVENTGNVTLTNVAVTDPGIAVSGAAITLIPGQVDTATFTATYTLEQGDINTGSFTNQATAAGTPPTGPPVSDLSDDPADPTGDNDPTITPILQTPALTVVKDATDVNFANVGDIVTYEYEVTNSGNTTITAPISITDNLITDPARISCAALPVGGLSPTAPDNTLICTGTYDVTQADLDRGTVTNLASATDGTTTSPTVSETIPDGAPAALAIDKTTANAPFTAVGEVITYTYVITNNGGRTLTGTTEVIDDRISGPISCFTGNLVPVSLGGTSQSCTANYTITQADLDAGSVTNEAFAQNDNVAAVGTVTSPTDTVTLDADQQPSISIEKVGDASGLSPIPQVGDEITYTFRIENTGNVTLTNVIVDDADAVISGSPIATLAPLDPTAVTQTNVDTTTYSATRALTQEDIDAGEFENQASVRATPPAGAEVTDLSDDPADATSGDDPTVISIPQSPSIEIEKSATLDDFGDGIADVGDEILYTFTVTNTGNVTLSDISISDADATITGGPITLAPSINDTATFTGVHVLVQSDIDAGTFSNQAIVSATPPGGAAPITEPSDDPATGTDDDPTTITIPANPSIVITKIGTVDDGGDGSVDVDDVINYTFRVENTGNVTLTNVAVTDADAVVSGGILASLAPDTVDATTFTAQHVLTQAEIDSGSYENQATVEGTPFAGGAPVSDLSDDPFDPAGNDDPTIIPLTQDPSISIDKVSSIDDGGDGSVDVGDAINYTFTVTNTGNVTLTNITLDDPDATVSGGSITSLAPADIDTGTFTAQHILTQDEIDSGSFENQATVTGTPPGGAAPVSDLSDDPADATGEDDPTVTLIPNTPSISVEKVGVLDDGGDGRVDVDDVINYTFTVTNTGNVTLTNITLNDPDATVSGDPIASLSPTIADTTTFTAQRILTQDDINSGQFENQATVSGTPPNGPAVTDLSDDPADATSGDDPTIISILAAPSIAVEKVGVLDDGGDGRVDVDDVINYTFTVTNTGNVTLTNITLDDPDATVSGGSIASLLPDGIDTATFTAQRVLTQDDINSGSFENQATVSGTPPSGPAVSDLSDDPADATGEDDPTIIDLAPAPSISITKVSSINDGGDGSIDENDVINYTFTVTNTGNVTLTNITLDDPDATVSGGSITSLAPDGIDTATFTAQHVLTQDEINSGRFENQATVTGTPPNGGTPVTDLSDDPANATGQDDPTVTLLAPLPSIAVTKVSSIDDGGDGRVDVDDVINYTFTVTNTGNVTLTNITLDDPDATVSGGSIASLLPDGIDTATFTAQRVLTQDDINSGLFENQATVTGTPPSGPAVSDLSDDPANATGEDDPTLTTLPTLPSISIEKVGVVDDGGDGSVDVDDVINYTFTVTNTGNVTLTDITLDDPDATVSGGSIASLLPDAIDTATFTAQHILTQEEINSGSFENQATVSGTPPNGAAPVTDLSDDPIDATGEDDPTTTLLPATPSIAIEKVAAFDDGGDGRIDVDDAITYTFTVTNTGNVTLTDITLDDPNADVSGGPIASLAPNGIDTATFTARHVLTQEEINSGSFENQATVSGTPPGGAAPVTDLSDDPADATGEDDPTVIAIPDAPSIAVEKVGVVDDGGDGSVDVDDVINYTFTVTNTGNVTLTNITLDDPDATVSGGSIASLLPGVEDTSTFTAQHVLTLEEINSGSFENQATVSGTPPNGGTPVTDLSDDPTNPAGENDPTVTPLLLSPSISVTKVSSIDDGGDGSVDEGDAINYTFTVTNTGNVTLTDITLNDPDATVTGGPIGSMLPNDIDTATFTAQHILTLDEINSGSFENQATVSGTPPNGADPITALSDDPVNDTGEDDPTVTTLPALPSIAIEKTATVNDGGDGSVDEGDTITYAFRIENTGNVTLTDVAVTDPNAVVSGGTITLIPGQIDLTTITAVHTLTQEEINSGSFENQATVSGTPPNGGAPVTDLSDDPTNPAGEDDPTVTLLEPMPSIAVEKVADISGFDSPAVAGNEIAYTFTVTNTGNVTLTNITLDDPDANVSGGPIAALLPNISDTVTFTAVRVLSQEDINAGSFTNQATITGNPPTGPPVTDLSDDPTNPAGNDDPTVTEIPAVPLMELEKSLVSVTQVFPFVYDLVYQVDVQNTGNVTLTDMQLVDDLSASLSPASIVSTTHQISGFTGTGSANTNYDGVSETNTLSGDVQLEPTQSATVVINTRVNFTNGFPSQGNTATATSATITTPVLSNDPSVTPGDAADTNPTPPPLQDADGDGSPDSAESSTADRDGDGIPDAADYDPTGYFYCQETARILPGGLISVTGPIGTQSGVGSSNNITIVRDGADGSFQFFVSAPGTYTLNATVPPTGVASPDRLSLGTLDATTLLPANPAVLGAGELGNSNDLSDGSASGNPFYFTFEIEEGDPAIFNNNIPLSFCGSPELTASKVETGAPTLQSNGNTQFTFQMSAQNTGTTQVNSVSLSDDLDAVFGAGNYSVVSNQVTSSPVTFGASSNSGYNGGSNIELLQAGGILLPSQRVEVQLVVEVAASMSGTFTNTVTAAGASPLDGTPITPNTASTDITVVAPNDVNPLQVEKVAGRSLVRIGEILPYSVTVTNPAALPRIGVNIVDFLPAGITYRVGSAQIDGVAFEPTLSGRRLVFPDQDIGANSSVTVTFNTAVSAAATASEFENQAWVEDPTSGDRISNVGIATVRREIEHVFDCGEIIGKVFDDKNRNGYQDQGEPGLPGVRVATVKGLLITTDKHGRYHVPCAAVPDADIGSNFILKLDTRTLPTGYRITTENPRVVRLTRGKLTKLNFGASISRVIRIDLNSTAFVSNSIEPSKALTNAFGTLIKKLDQEPSVLRLSYHSSETNNKLAKKRMRNIAKLIKKRWRRSGGTYDLEIETRVVKK